MLMTANILSEKTRNGNDVSSDDLSFPKLQFRLWSEIISLVLTRNLVIFTDVVPTNDHPVAENSTKSAITVALPAKEASSKSAEHVTSSINEQLSSEVPVSTLTSSSAANTIKVDSSTTSGEEKARGKLLKSHSVSTGTSPPPQNISTQVRLQIIAFTIAIFCGCDPRARARPREIQETERKINFM